MTYDFLLCVADHLNLITKEKDLQAYDGRIKGRRIAIRHDLPTYKAKACVLAEELGHYATSSGDILDDSAESRKQELKARMWAYNLQIGLSGLIKAKQAGCRNLYETAEYLNVPEKFLAECLEGYRQKYGISVKYQNYIIYFEPSLDILTLQEVRERANDW